MVRDIGDSMVTYDPVANTIVIDALSDPSELPLIILGFAHQDMSVFKVCCALTL